MIVGFHFWLLVELVADIANDSRRKVLTSYSFARWFRCVQFLQAERITNARIVNLAAASIWVRLYCLNKKYYLNLIFCR